MVILLFGVLTALALFTASALAGRGSTGKAQRIAFFSGLLGLASLSVWLITLFMLWLQLPYLRLASPAGALFVASSAALLGAGVYALLALLSLRRLSRQ